MVNDYRTLIISGTITSIIVFIISIMRSKDLWFNVYEKTETLSYQELISYSLPFVFSAGLTSIFDANDKLFLNLFWSAKEVGLFSSAVSLLTFVNLAKTTFTTMWALLAMEEYSKNPRNTKFFVNVNEIVTVIMFF